MASIEMRFQDCSFMAEGSEAFVGKHAEMFRSMAEYAEPMMPAFLESEEQDALQEHGWRKIEDGC